MTQISTIHDAIVTKISSNLTSHKQLPNPYILEANTDLFLQKGFGVAIGAGVRTDRYVSNQIVTWERSFIITLTEKITTTESNITAKETITKTLLEDHFTLLKKFDQDISLTLSALGVTFTSDGGFDYVEFNGRPHFVCEIELLVEYQEDITS